MCVCVRESLLCIEYVLVHGAVRRYSNEMHFGECFLNFDLRFRLRVDVEIVERVNTFGCLNGIRRYAVLRLISFSE